MPKVTRRTFRRRVLPESRLVHYPRCRREDATDPTTTSVERLALVRMVGGNQKVEQ